MSRFSQMVVNKKGEPLELAWGFDHVLGYWYDIHDPLMNEDSCIIEEWSSSLGYTFKNDIKGDKSRSNMLEFLIKYDLPEEHRSAVGLDYPF